MQEQLPFQPPEGFTKMIDGTLISWVIGGVVSFFVWLFRLEGKIKLLEREVAKNDDIFKTLSELSVSIARIEGHLSKDPARPSEKQ